MKTNIESLIARGAKTKEESILIGKHLFKKRHKCACCGRLSYYTHSINGGPWISYDGHFSLTGRDDRTIDGTPLWQGGIEKGKIVFGILNK